MGILDKVKELFASDSGGKRPRYRTQTEDGQQILIESQEAVIGNSEATAFFTDLCGGSLKEVMMSAGATNVPMPEVAGPDAIPKPVAARVGANLRMGPKSAGRGDIRQRTDGAAIDPLDTQMLGIG